MSALCHKRTRALQQIQARDWILAARPHHHLAAVGERSVAARKGGEELGFLLPVSEKIVRPNAARHRWQVWKVACRSLHPGRCLASRPRA
jgi:hypothetical protein